MPNNSPSKPPVKKSSVRSDAKNSSAQNKKSKNTFPIVAIGASAGGLEAVTKLLENLPKDIGMVFVIVQHLDPKHPSQLTAILGRSSKISVVEVKNGMIAEPNKAYVIPPNVDLTWEESVFRLTPRNNAIIHLPIDHLFRSLAIEKVRTIGVVLSGTGSDGTIGLAEIKAAGGITFAQDLSAKYPGMPMSAIDSGVVGFVFTPPKKLAQIWGIISPPNFF
jgi:two-component system CheB/CheR fusion protein